ncbi:MAG: serine hydrolase [Candidatus Aminicenantes bacterium]|nr:serine hydrolase [Candidatus Aminicenantes bacterium]NIO79451.1 serine hydrolase [Candidatus Aminicenantes bacterium]NIQ65404.1 serine hydrolase [Candidatus Aminicenantes bacterium]NIT21406.1 serine hydrolase [Candidatus Aminicenantes bacterium]
MNVKFNIYIVIFLLALLFSVFLFLACGQHSGLTNKTNSIDEYLMKLEAHGFSGSVLVAQNGNILLQKGYGLANVQTSEKFSEETQFPIASITKSITATAILLLEKKGKLKTTDHIGQFFKDVPNDKKEITIHHLLSHTSGLVRDVQRTSRDKLLRLILDSKLIHPVGKQFAYSNAGYQLLGLLIEKITGDLYEQFILKRVFQPLNLTCSFENDSSVWRQIPMAFDESQNYTIFKKNYRAENKIGQGGIVCSITDLYKWFFSLLNGDIIDNQHLAKAFSPQVMIKNQGNYTGYGYGFYLNFADPEDRVIIHGGDIFGYHSELQWYKDSDRVIILFSNKELYGLGVHKRIIVSNINKLLNGKKIIQPEEFETLSSDEKLPYVGDYKIDENNLFHVWHENNHLMIGAEGQEAINLIAVHNQDQKEYINQKNRLTQQIVTALTTGQEKILKDILSKSEYDFFVSYWVDVLENSKKKYGKLRKVIVKGANSYPWQEKYIRCYAYYFFENKTVDISYVWDQNTLRETLEESGVQYPVVMRLVKHSENVYSVFDLVTSKGQLIRFDDQKLSIKVKGNPILAIKY